MDEELWRDDFENEGPNTEASRAARQKPHGRDLKWNIVESAQFKAVNLRSKFLKRQKRNGAGGAADGNGGGGAAWRRLKPQIEDIALTDTDELTTRTKWRRLKSHGSDLKLKVIECTCLKL